MPRAFSLIKKLQFSLCIFLLLFGFRASGFEIDITGLSAHIDRGFQQQNSGILLDGDGRFVLNPGIAGKVVLTGYESEWGDVDLLWQFGGMFDCRFLPMIFTGPILRFSFHISERWSIDLNLALSIMGTIQWLSGFDSGAIQPYAYPSIRYRDEDGRGISVNLAYMSRNTGFIPAAGSNLLFLFGSIVPSPTTPSIALIGLSTEEQNLFRHTLAKDGIKITIFSDPDTLISRIKDGYAPKMIVVPDNETKGNLKVVKNSGGENIPVVLFESSVIPYSHYLGSRDA